MSREGLERWEDEDVGVGEDSWMRRVGTGRWGEGREVGSWDVSGKGSIVYLYVYDDR